MTALASAADALGYRRPLPERGRPDYSMNDRSASASGTPPQGEVKAAALEERMDRASSPPEGRWLSDWRLGLKTILAFWAFYFLMATGRALLLEMPGQFELLQRRVLVVIGAIAITWLVYLALQPTARATIRVKIIVAALAGIPASLALAATNYYWLYLHEPLRAAWIGPRHDAMADLPITKIIAESTHNWYFFLAAWSAIYVALSYARQLREADTRSAALAREAQEAQLRALRYQINPHFLFNTLNSLSSLVLAERTETAERMLMNLSSFFRTTLSADPTADVPLSEEITLQQLYLDIEQIRFPERLRVEIDVPPALLNRRVPVLILQPVVENSVKYGVARSRKPVTVTINAYEEAGRLHIKVRDDGEQSCTCGDEGGTGVGLANVTDRLVARYGKAAGVIHGPDPQGGYTVHLYMPVVTDG